jgi:hypothetical protein
LSIDWENMAQWIWGLVFFGGYRPPPPPPPPLLLPLSLTWEGSSEEAA